MLKQFRQKKIKKEKGFVILFAMVVSMTIILLSSGMFNTTKKQTIISSYARESQKAFYVANSALECAIYNDISPYIEVTKFPVHPADGFSSTLSCGGNTITAKSIPVDDAASGYEDLFSFRYPVVNTEAFGFGNNEVKEDTGCAYVLVEKKIGDEVNGGDLREVVTRITAVGFNTCVPNNDTGEIDIPNFKDPTLLERRISSTYSTVTQKN